MRAYSVTQPWMRTCPAQCGMVGKYQTCHISRHCRETPGFVTFLLVSRFAAIFLPVNWRLDKCLKISPFYLRSPGKQAKSETDIKSATYNHISNNMVPAVLSIFPFWIFFRKVFREIIMEIKHFYPRFTEFGVCLAMFRSSRAEFIFKCPSKCLEVAKWWSKLVICLIFKFLGFSLFLVESPCFLGYKNQNL